MADMTKAIPNGWVAPYYDKEGERDEDFDVIVKPSMQHDHLPFCVVTNSPTNLCLITLSQAYSLIDALQRAVKDYEERQ